MNFKRIFTALISLMLVCCLLVNVSPIKADALGAELAAYLTVKNVLIGTLAALGVTCAVGGAEHFKNEVQTWIDAGLIIQKWHIENDTVGLYHPDLNQYYIAKDMVDSVRSWLFSNKVISDTVELVETLAFNGTVVSPGMPMHLSFTDGKQRWYCDSTVNFYGAYYDNLYKDDVQRQYGLTTYVISDSPFKLYNQYSQYYRPDCEAITVDGRTYYYISGGGGTVTSTDSDWYSEFCSMKPSLYEFFNSDELSAFTVAACITGVTLVEHVTATVADGFAQEYIAPISQDLATGYASWMANSVAVPNAQTGEKEIYLPLALGDTVENTMALTQADAWRGLSTIDDNVDPPETQPPDDDFGDDTLLTELTTLGLFNLIRRLHSEYIAQQLTDILTDILASPSPTLDHYHAEWRAMMQDLFSHISSFFQEVTQSLSHLQTQLSTQLSSMTSQLTFSLSQLQTKFVEKLDELTQTLSQVMEAVRAKTLESTKEAFLPEDNYLKNKVDDLTSNYVFADSIANTGKDLKDFFLTLGSVPPVIYINLSHSTGSLDWGNDMVLIDFSFYEPYKPVMDSILSAFLWLWFCWRIVLSLPGIISGASGMFGGKIDVSHIGSSGYFITSSLPPNDPVSSGRIFQSNEERQRGTKAYEEWRKNHK